MGRNHLMVLMIFIFIFSSCKGGEENSYDLPIPKEKLIHIMMDLTIAEAAAASYQVKYRDSIKNLYRYQIETIHKVNISTVDSTLQLLYQNPILNKELQKTILDSLKAMEKLTKRDI